MNAACFGRLAVVAVLVHGCAERRDEPAAKRSKDPARLRAEKAAHDRRVAELRATYATTCDRRLVPELARLYREDARLEDARKLESEPCALEPPSCAGAKASIDRQLATRFQLTRDKTFNLHCMGGIFERAGVPTAGFAIVMSGRAADGTPRAFRGVLSTAGDGEIVPFIETLASRLVGVVDLDRDNYDEVVLVAPTELLVARVRSGVFVDVVGPAMPERCSADANVEGDFRKGRKGERRLLILTVPDEVGSGCLSPGRHYYALAGDKLVETD